MRTSIHPRNVTATDDYKLHIVFENGERKMFDVEPYLNDSLWAPLKNIAKFKQAKVNGITVAWDDVIDFCPDELYCNSVPIQA